MWNTQLIFRIATACLIATVGILLLRHDFTIAISLLIVSLVLPIVRTQRTGIWVFLFALVIPQTLVHVIFPWTLLAWPRTYELHWVYKPTSNAYQSITLDAKGTVTKEGWFGRKEVWGHKAPESSMTTIAITTNRGEKIIAQVSKLDDGELKQTLIHEDGSQEPFTQETLKLWLQEKGIELASWEFGFDSEFSELYFAIFAATGGALNNQADYSTLQIVD